MIRAFLVGLGLTMLPALASAAEKQHHLGAAPTVSLLRADSFGNIVGAGATAMYTYGLTDQFNLMAEVSHSFMGIGRELVRSPFSKTSPRFDNRPSFITTGSVGASYVLDVLRWVPYGGVLLSGNVFGGGSTPSVQVAPGAELAVGLDYQFSRHLVGGVGYRQRFLFTRLPDYPFFGSAFLKVEYQWGF